MSLAICFQQLTVLLTPKEKERVCVDEWFVKSTCPLILTCLWASAYESDVNQTRTLDRDMSSAYNGQPSKMHGF